jgi:hypothetical protein
MAMRERTRAISDVLDGVEQASGDEVVTVGAIVAHLGDRSFAALLLVPGLAMLSPLSGIPGLATVSASLVALIVVQMLLGRRSLWLPRVLGDRRISARRLHQAVGFLRRPVWRAEGMMAPRLGVLADRPWNALALATCLAITLIVPLMEIVPFLATTAGLAISLIAAGMLVRDGLVMAAGYGVVLLGILFARTVF